MKVSSVSPERWLTITPQPLVWAILQLKDTGPHKTLFYRRTHLPLSLFTVIKLLCAGHSRLQGLGDGADLVDLEQQAVAGLLGHALGDALGVGDREVVTHHLDAGAGCEVGPCLPVILVKGVLDGHH